MLVAVREDETDVHVNHVPSVRLVSSPPPSHAACPTQCVATSERDKTTTNLSVPREKQHIHINNAYRCSPPPPPPPPTSSQCSVVLPMLASTATDSRFLDLVGNQSPTRDTHTYTHTHTHTWKSVTPVQGASSLIITVDNYNYKRYKLNVFDFSSEQWT